LSLKDKLQRLQSHLTLNIPSMTNEGIRETPDTARHSEISQESVSTIPYLEKWSQLQTRPRRDGDNYILFREVSIPVAETHGPYAFAELHEIIERWNERRSTHPLSAHGRRVRDLMFFDTETTGLQGGTGNTIFLLGLAQVDEEAVMVKQLFLPGPEHESALYRAFLQEVRTSTHLVTYNGKAFDWPQVKTRHTLVREEVPALPAVGHYDLLHAARRLWKHRLESCRLSMVEEQILGIVREEDTPGYMAPYLYFEFLRSQNPEHVEGVLRHNETDVLSLIALYIHISKRLLERDPLAGTGDEQLEIARWYEAIGEWESAIECYQMIMEHYPDQRGNAILGLANLYKSQKRWTDALTLWELYCKEHARVPATVYIELAKVYEHELHDYDKALYYADLAYEHWRRKQAVLRTGKEDRERAQLLKRIERLERKLIHLR
jgi:uncharacterized protein YprB with RNaseH-like and TPR domain